jgi:hypothetical protein
MDWMGSIVAPLVGGVAKGLTQSFAGGGSGGGGGGSAPPMPSMGGLMAPIGKQRVNTDSSVPAPVTNTDSVTARWAALLGGAK